MSQFTPVKIGNILFPHKPVILAPMEDVSDPPFRIICRSMGADWVFSEFISADGLARNAEKSHIKLSIFPEERPVSVQIFGADAESMAEAAKIIEEVNPDFIDINFGCPVRKVASKGAGAGMLQNIPKMGEITDRVVKAVKLPVTVKTRLGWDINSKNILEVALRLQDAGIAALTIHGRTRCQMYRGVADWTMIRDVKNNPGIKIPVIGNGDIVDGLSAKNAFDFSGVDGIMIGRGAIGNPWVFGQINHFLRTGKISNPPSIDERTGICLQHLQKSVEWKGEKSAVLEMRKQYSYYFKGVKNFKPFRKLLTEAATAAEVIKIIEQIRNHTFEVDDLERKV